MAQHRFGLVLGVRAASEPAQIQGEVGEDHQPAMWPHPDAWHSSLLLSREMLMPRPTRPETDLPGAGCGLGIRMQRPQSF